MLHYLGVFFLLAHSLPTISSHAIRSAVHLLKRDSSFSGRRRLFGSSENRRFSSSTASGRQQTLTAPAPGVPQKLLRPDVYGTGTLPVGHTTTQNGIRRRNLLRGHFFDTFKHTPQISARTKGENSTFLFTRRVTMAFSFARQILPAAALLFSIFSTIFFSLRFLTVVHTNTYNQRTQQPEGGAAKEPIISRRLFFLFLFPRKMRRRRRRQ